MSRVGFEFRIAHDHPSLAGHFPGRPIVPGVLLLDEVMTAVQRAGGRDVVRVQQARFLAALLPGEVAHGWHEITGSKATFAVAVTRDGNSVQLAEGSLQLAPQEHAA
jgi:3-hydroxyacyl-[acyl-carrier-protein] dehydratase